MRLHGTDVCIEFRLHTVIIQSVPPLLIRNAYIECKLITESSLPSPVAISTCQPCLLSTGTEHSAYAMYAVRCMLCMKYVIVNL